MTSVEKLVFSLRHRVIVPAAPEAPTQDGAVAARQVDAVLMDAGFKCSGELLAALGALAPAAVIDLGAELIGWARELAGDHVRHNAYFIDFPAGVPDTLDFWLSCLREALAGPATAARVQAMPGTDGDGDGDGDGPAFNLLSLPRYGRYQHTYEEMVARHDELVPALSDRVTVVHLGATLAREAAALYGELAASPVPLSAEALDALRFLAAYHGGLVEGVIEGEIKVRENKAVINAARVRAGLAPAADTPTDVLRLAAELSGADVTLTTPPRFRSLPRAQRRALLAALDAVIEAAPARLADVGRHAEQWKRLGERLHPHEANAAFHGSAPGSASVFAVARGELAAPSLAAQAEAAFASGDVTRAARTLAASPGMLWRAADRVLRTAAQSSAQNGTAAGPAPGDVTARLLEAFAQTAPKVSGRVLLSVREHLVNRAAAKPGGRRVFVNRNGRGHVIPDARGPLDPAVVGRLLSLIDEEILRRLPEPGRLIIDPAIESVALPLSGKGAPEGLRVFPRGSVTPVPEGLDVLRFFIYWKQRRRTTDFDLSALMTDEQFGNVRWLSYTNLSNFGGEHSGDITSAPEGASEFINVHLDRLGRGFVIPQVFVYSGEGFGEVAESLFGYLALREDQRGAPFEPRTVRARSGLAGDGRAAMPLLFYRGEDGRWYAKWLHLYLRGNCASWGGTRVEENRVTSRLLAQSIMDREYLRVAYLTELLQRKAATSEGADQPVTYVGVERPEDLPPGATVYTLANLARLIPQ
ncbi:MAG TPA: TerD family protein [Trebonia sp.]|nr:TerD family protein [Trebonia sp.]